MPGHPRLLFAGAATIDMIFAVESLPTGPGKVLPKAMVQAAHGMATSAAITAARLGGHCALVSRVGNDLMGERFISEVEAEGVDCRHVLRFDGVPTPLATVIVDARGERLVIPYYDPRLGTDANWIGPDLIDSVDAVEVDIRWPEAAARLLTLARNGGKIGVLDGDVGPTETLAPLAELASHVIFSEPAACQLSGSTDVRAALISLAARFSGFVAVTAGGEGCFWLEGGELQQARPPSVTAIDTLAAGDVFHGAFTLAIAEGKPPAEAIAFANAAAAIKCTVFGGRLGAPNRQAVENMLGRH